MPQHCWFTHYCTRYDLAWVPPCTWFQDPTQLFRLPLPPVISDTEIVEGIGIYIWSTHQKDGSHRWKRAGSKCGGNGAQLFWWRSCGQSYVPIMVQSLKKADRSHKIHFSLLETTAVSKPINLAVKYKLWTTDSKIWTLLTSSTRHQYKNSIYNNCFIRS